jgi:uncharacterized protein YndB with AHSA1/START domain
MSDEECRVERETVLPATADEVWAALTEKALLEEWLASEVELDLEEGGEATFRSEDGDERSGRVELVDAPHRFAFRWGRPLEAETLVEFTLEEVADGCRLVVVETGAPAALSITGARWSASRHGLARASALCLA